MKRIVIAVTALSLLSGCALFGRGDDDKAPKTPVLGERVPVLNAESSADVDPALADLPVVVPDPIENADWAQSGGNAQHSMGHPALPLALGRAWSAKIGGSTKQARLAAAPVVAGGNVYVIDILARVYSFNAKTGALNWKSRVGTGEDIKKSTNFFTGKESGNARALFGGGVSFDGGRLYATNGVGDAAALDATDGKVLWKVRPGGPLRGAPTVANGTVYVVSQDNQIFALKAEDGSVIWNEAATLENAGVFGVAAPAVGQGTVVAGFSSGELTAFRYENGRAVWQDALSRTSISTSVASLADIDADPVIDQGRVYAVGQGGRMVAMELVSGQRLWEVNVAGIATPWVAGDWLFVVTDDARLLCIARTSGKVRWITQLPRWKNVKKKKNPISWSGPVLAGGRLLLASTQGELVNVAIADGAVGTRAKLGSPVYLPPVVAENTLFVLEDSGRLSAWR